MSSPENMPPSGRDPALRAAIAWYMRLAEDPDDLAAQEAFEIWMAEEPGHASAWSHACRTMGLLEQGKSVSFLPTGAQRQQPSEQRPRRFRIARILVPAMAAALVVAVAPHAVVRWNADYVTGKGETRTIALSDGSSIRMAPGSAIAVRYASDTRSVDLLSGEAYFEVTPNPARPFRVAARTAHVTVLGTGFDVRLGDGGADIAVRHGRVRVEDGGRDKPFSTMLTDGQWVRLGKVGRAEIGETGPSNVGSWSNERLIALGQPLREVIADLRRYHRGIIMLTDGDMGRRIVTGSYDVRDPAKAVETVTAPLGARVTRITPWIILVSSG